MEKDAELIYRLRETRNWTADNWVSLALESAHLMFDAANKIEQLQKKIAYLEEQVDRWEDDALRLMNERNEARREVCLWQGLNTGNTSRDTAVVRGWNCFEEDGK